jgi:uncharacterized membrane protein
MFKVVVVRQIHCLMVPNTPTDAPLKTWIHEAQDEGKWNALISDRLESLDDEEENQQTESQTETPTTQDVTPHEEEEGHITNVFNFNESECTDIH